MIESREKVISNIATEERNTHNMTPLIASDMTFFKVIFDYLFMYAYLLFTQLSMHWHVWDSYVDDDDYLFSWAFE